LEGVCLHTYDSAFGINGYGSEQAFANLVQQYGVGYNGAAGAAGQAGLSIQWLGSLTQAPLSVATDSLGYSTLASQNAGGSAEYVRFTQYQVPYVLPNTNISSITGTTGGYGSDMGLCIYNDSGQYSPDVDLYSVDTGQASSPTAWVSESTTNIPVYTGEILWLGVVSSNGNYQWDNTATTNYTYYQISGMAFPASLTPAQVPNQGTRSYPIYVNFTTPAPAAQTDWAYFNTVQGESFIYDGTAWNELCQNGATGPQGATGATGATGTTGLATNTTISTTASTGAEQSIIQYQIPASGMLQGETYRIDANGVIGSTSSAPTTTWRVRIGPTELTGTIVGSVAPSMGVSISGKPWDLVAYVTVVTIGTTPTVLCTMYVEGLFATSSAYVYAGTTATTATSLGTASTSAQYLGLSFQFGTANSANTITTVTSSIEEVVS
jgi:hypothetical protein